MQNRREFLKSASGFALGAAAVPAVASALVPPKPQDVVWSGAVWDREVVPIGVAMGSSGAGWLCHVATGFGYGSAEMRLRAAATVAAGQIVVIDNFGCVVPYPRGEA